jgi:hypothetical protein
MHITEYNLTNGTKWPTLHSVVLIDWSSHWFTSEIGHFKKISKHEIGSECSTSTQVKELMIPNGYLNLLDSELFVRGSGWRGL